MPVDGDRDPEYVTVTLEVRIPQPQWQWCQENEIVSLRLDRNQVRYVNASGEAKGISLVDLGYYSELEERK